MNERRMDFELLVDFARRGAQEAFANVVRRHIDLVYATALRKVEDQGAAEEVAQNVFAALAKKAWQFAPDDSLPAWLYQTTLLEAKGWVRGELRRRRREQTAAELGTTMKTPDEQTTFRALVPLLDEALLSLREKDRTALLLRFYDSQSLRELGGSLGVGEDAAQKRVASALEKLAAYFRRRGFKTATIAAAAAALEHTATAAPVAVAASLTQAAMQVAPPALAGLAAAATRFTGLTKIQTAALCAAIAIVPATWQWNEIHLAEKEASSARVKLDDLRAQQDRLVAETGELRAESTRLDGLLAGGTQAQANDAEVAHKQEGLKARVFALLTATDYRWPDDLPFVRIPKSALNELRPGDSFDTSGKIRNWGAEILGITVEESERVNQIVPDYLQSVAQLINTRACETNYLPTDLTSRWARSHWKTIAVPALSEDAAALADVMVEQLRETLGEDRANLLMGDAVARKSRLYSWLGKSLDFADKPQTITVCLDLENPEGIECRIFKNDGTGSSGGGWRFDSKDEVKLLTLPDAINRQFFEPWLRQLGITNSSLEGNR